MTAAQTECLICQEEAKCQVTSELTQRLEHVLEVALTPVTLYLCADCLQKLEEIEKLITDFKKLYHTSNNSILQGKDVTCTEELKPDIHKDQVTLPPNPQTDTVTADNGMPDAGPDDDTDDDDVTREDDVTCEGDVGDETGEGPLKKKRSNYSCGCGDVYYTPRDLETHRKEKHGGGVPCRDCGVTLRTPEELQDHSLLHKKDRYNCNACGMGFHRALYLRNHQRLSRKCSHVTKAAAINHCGPNECGCGERFESLSELKSHLKKEHGGRFVCQHCKRTFGTHGTLKRHMYFHSDDAYNCPECGESFRHPTYVQIHQRRYHRRRGARPGRVRGAGRCRGRAGGQTTDQEAYDAVTDTEEQQGGAAQPSQSAAEIDANMKTDDEVTPPPPVAVPSRDLQEVPEVLCPVCDTVYQSAALLDKHVHTHHWRQPQTGRGAYTCVLCEKTLRSVRGIIKHVRTHRHEMHVCRMCDSVFAKKEHLIEHGFRAHKKETTQEALKSEMQCPECKMKLETQSLLSAHTLVEHGHYASFGLTLLPPRHRPHKCSFCNMSFSSRRDLQKHTTKHARALRDRTARPYQCPECKKPCKTSAGLEKHIQNFCPGKEGVYDEGTGRLKRSFRCDMCGAVYKTRSGYEMHMSKHTGEGSHQCDVCQQKFRMKAHLTKHMASHTRPYMCAQCGKRFSSANHLDEHQAIHSTDLNFNCVICNEKFRWRLSLARHQWRCHGIGAAPKRYRKLMQCKLCNAEVSRNDRATHFLAYHKETAYTTRQFKCLPCNTWPSNQGAVTQGTTAKKKTKPPNHLLPNQVPQEGGDGGMLNPTQGVAPMLAPEPPIQEEVVNTSLGLQTKHDSDGSKAVYTLVDANTGQVAVISSGNYIVQETGQALTTMPAVISAQPAAMQEHQSLIQQHAQPQTTQLQAPLSVPQLPQPGQYPGAQTTDAVGTWTNNFNVWQ